MRLHQWFVFLWLKQYNCKCLYIFMHACCPLIQGRMLKTTQHFEVDIPRSLLKGMSLYFVSLYSNNTPIISKTFHNFKFKI